MAWIALCATLIFIFSVHKWNSRRGLQIPPFALTANCLLTRHPFLFVGGRESLFYHGNYWNHLPHYLCQHGYEVFEMQIPIRGELRRRKEFRKLLNNLQSNAGEKYHLIIDATSVQELKSLIAEEDFPGIASISHVTSRVSSFSNVQLKPFKIPIEELIFADPRNTQKSIPLAWRFHRFFVSSADPSPSIIGLINQPDLQQIRDRFRQRAHELAERDFAQTGKLHERIQENSI